MISGFALFNKDELAESAVFAERGLDAYLISNEEENLVHAFNLAHKLYDVSAQIANGSLDADSAKAFEETIKKRYDVFGDLSLAQKVSCLAQELESIEQPLPSKTSENARNLSAICSDLSFYLRNKGALN